MESEAFLSVRTLGTGLGRSPESGVDIGKSSSSTSSEYSRFVFNLLVGLSFSLELIRYSGTSKSAQLL